MRTRCLECELSTYRSETFTNIDVPLHLEEPDDVDELSGPDLFLKQILMSETLRENNKYWCEECGRLNEAQRSVQYELLPKVLVLQLKRFTTASGGPKSSYVSKINDYIPTPFAMDCFCSQCMSHAGGAASGRRQPHQGGQRPSPGHHYRLYAVIMHLGATLASGHYIAYVRASQDSAGVLEYTRCQRGGGGVSGSSSSAPTKSTVANSNKTATSERNSKNKKGIMKFLRRGGDKNSSVSSSSSSGAAFASSSALSSSSSSHLANGDVTESDGSSSHAASTSSQSSSSSSSCRGATCCGIRAPLPERTAVANGGGGGGGAATATAAAVAAAPHHANGSSSSFSMVHQRSLDSTDSSDATIGDDASDVWLECDDESIQVISRRQFEGILSAKQGATTPYLLFYQKL